MAVCNATEPINDSSIFACTDSNGAPPDIKTEKLNNDQLVLLSNSTTTFDDHDDMDEFGITMPRLSPKPYSCHTCGSQFQVSCSRLID